MNRASARFRNAHRELLATKPLRPAVSRTRLLIGSAAAVLLAPLPSMADVLSAYTFGPDGVTPSILTPTTVHPNVTAGTITAGSGVTLYLASDQAPIPASSPWLRILFAQTTNTAPAAIANNAYFEFSLIANGGFLVDLASIAFDAMRGGASTPRGYDVRTSADNFATSIGTADIPTARPTFTNVSIDLTAPAYQDLTSITFRIYSYSPGTGSSVEYDNIIINGTVETAPFNGYTWTGAVDGRWNTTIANWSGAGATYVDATPTSDVLFGNAGAIRDITVDALTLHPNSVTFDSNLAYNLGGGTVEIATGLNKSGSGTATLHTVVTAASGSVSEGVLAVGLSGSLTVANGIIAPAGSLVIEPAGVLGATTGLQVNGNLTLNAASQTLATLAGGITGVVTLNGTVLNVTNSSAYSGSITGTGSIAKTSPGTLTLGGPGDYTGGTTVTGGVLQLNHPTAASAGPVLVEANGALSLGAAVTTPIVLNGGRLGVAAASTTPANVTVSADSIVQTFNPTTGAGSSDLILTGLLQGAGKLTLLSNNGNNPDSQAFRLRGAPSDYSGAITVTQSAKLELQTSVPVGSPMGTGTLVLTGGTTTTTQAGTYSLVNLRNLSGSDATLGNNVRIEGFGTGFFNMLGNSPEGSAMNLGDLLIGDGQAVGAGATDSVPFTLGFATVHLTGGNATFIPQPIGNTGFDMPQNIRLGIISENAPGSGIIMNGAAALTLTGANTYTGPTQLRSGTTLLAAGSSIASSSAVTVEAGALLDASALGTLAVPAAQVVTVNGTLNGAVQLSGSLRGAGQIAGTLTALAGSQISPGNSAGTLTVQNLALDPGAALEIELGKLIPGAQPVPGIDYDVLVATGSLGAVNGAVQLGGTLSLLVSAGIQENDVFTLILNNSPDPMNGEFAGLAHGSFVTAGAQVFQISYADDGTTAAFELAGGNDVSLLAVPEPGAAILLLGGLAACSFARSRQRSAIRATLG
jgi:fibronectin-binding autotransporter adhesin